MIKIILPTNQNLLNDLTVSILEDVCNRIFNTTVYQTQNENRSNGRFVKIFNEETNEAHYVCFSNPNNDGRNSHLMQFVSPAYIRFYNDTAEDKHLHIYLINPNGNDKTDYIKMFYRCFLTIGINILNLDALGLSDIVKFNTYEDLKSYRKKNRDRNSHNHSTYFDNEDEKISIYGKTFGANGMESFIFALTIHMLVNKKIIFYPVLDNQIENLSQKQQNIFNDIDIIYEVPIKLISKNGVARANRDTSRNSPVFHYNLLQKYGDKQCYLCGCDLEHTLRGAHIERVADINANTQYTEEQKSRRATDGDNGFWLCGLHDLMFEYGIVYFENDTLQFSSLITEKKQQEFIDKSVFEMRSVYFDDEAERPFRIKSIHYNNKIKEYLELHKKRIILASD